VRAPWASVSVSAQRVGLGRAVHTTAVVRRAEAPLAEAEEASVLGSVAPAPAKALRAAADRASLVVRVRVCVCVYALARLTMCAA
jgi:hypothetical protein